MVKFKESWLESPGGVCIPGPLIGSLVMPPAADPNVYYYISLKSSNFPPVFMETAPGFMCVSWVGVSKKTNLW